MQLLKGSSKMNSTSPTMLLVGGSGFVSGALARLAIQRGYQVWAVTRGQRALPEGVIGLVADRHDSAAFEAAVAVAAAAAAAAGAAGSAGANAGKPWDLVVDCIGFAPEDLRQDVAAFRERARHFIFVSTDFVYDPFQRTYPQPEETTHFWQDGYGWKKRLCELELIEKDTAPMPWTIIRPCHIYGPGSLLGTMPDHRRDPQLIARLKAGEPLRLVGGGHFLQHPIFVDDLARVILSLAGNPKAYGQIFNAAGPDLVEAAEYFRIVARHLGVELKVEETLVSEYLAAHPDDAPSCCNRYYDMSKLRQIGAYLPDTALESGLKVHVESINE
jgi:nucleoside-diphosphate-sugar epimerase